MKRVNMKRGIFLLLVLVVLLPVVLAADVAFVTNNPRTANADFISSFEDSGLSVQLIKNSDVRKTDFSQFRLIFVGDERLTNAKYIPIDKVPSIISNYYYGPIYGLTDSDGISLLASTSPLEVKKGSEIIQVYDRAKSNAPSSGLSVQYYYLGNGDKPSGITSVAKTYSGNHFDLGDVIAYAASGTKLNNGKTAQSNICYFGIAKTPFWTSETEELFQDCIGYVSSVCSNDTDCDDSNPSTQDICLNPGTPQSECTHNPIVCSQNSDCGTDKYIGDKFCIGKDLKRNYLEFECNAPATVLSFCSNETSQKLIETCSDACYNGACVNIECNTDSDCDDSNINTEDICLNPGTINSSCQHNEIICLQDSDCGTNAFTGEQFCSGNNVLRNFLNYTCLNAGTSYSSCHLGSSPKKINECPKACFDGGICIECNENSDCDDNNASTADTCRNPSTAQAFCEHQIPNCFKDSDCGQTGFVGTEFCIGKSVFKIYNAYTCMNKGTFESHCISNSTNLLLQVCADSCQDGSCQNFVCKNDTDCDDSNPSTQDICLNPSTPQASCIHNPIRCSSDIECGGSYPLDFFCSDKDLKRNFLNNKCNLPGTPASFCSNSTTSNLIETCSQACSNGECVNFTCSQNSDCGSTIYGDNFCIGKDVKRKVTTFSCFNPNTTQSSCQNTTATQHIQTCSDACSSGSCVDIQCSFDSDCGTNAFTGEQFCSGKDVKRKFISFDCLNPGTILSSCSNSTISKLIETCSDACSNGECADFTCSQDSDCGSTLYGNKFCSGKDVKRKITTFSCLNPNTLASQCHNSTTTHLLETCSDACSNGECVDIPCSLDSQCGTNGFFGDNFCSGKDVKRKFITFQCMNSGTPSSFCSNSTTSKLIETCSDACDDGSCKEVPCSQNSDCGTNAFFGDKFCSGKDVKQNFLSFTCNNPGLPISFCSNTTTQKIVQTCPDLCSDGTCKTPLCSKDSDCGTDTQLSVFCSANDLFQTLKIFKCNNPGTINAFCSNSEIDSLLEDCPKVCNSNKCVACVPGTTESCALSGCFFGSERTCSPNGVWGLCICKPAPQCKDGKDNDGDGKYDYPADPQCKDKWDNDESK